MFFAYLVDKLVGLNSSQIVEIVHKIDYRVKDQEFALILVRGQLSSSTRFCDTYRLNHPSAKLRPANPFTSFQNWNIPDEEIVITDHRSSVFVTKFENNLLTPRSEETSKKRRLFKIQSMSSNSDSYITDCIWEMDWNIGFIVGVSKREALHRFMPERSFSKTLYDAPIGSLIRLTGPYTSVYSRLYMGGILTSSRVLIIGTGSGAALIIESIFALEALHKQGVRPVKVMIKYSTSCPKLWENIRSIAKSIDGIPNIITDIHLSKGIVDIKDENTPLLQDRISRHNLSIGRPDLEDAIFSMNPEEIYLCTSAAVKQSVESIISKTGKQIKLFTGVDYLS